MQQFIELDDEYISPKIAMTLWRRVLAQLINDYLSGCPDAAKHIYGVQLKYLCGIVGFDTNTTRRAAELAKKQYEKSGMRLRDWLKRKYQNVGSRAKEQIHNQKLKRLMGHQRLSKVCPDLADYLERSKKDYLNWTEKRKNAPRCRKVYEQQRVKQFFEVFWGGPGSNQTNRLQDGV